QASVRSLQVRPIALDIDAEHPAASLPSIAHLAAEHSAGRIVAAFTEGRRNGGPEIVVDVPAFAGRTATAVKADIEATPVIDRRDHGRRLGVRRCGQIGGGRRCGHAQRCNQSGRAQQDLLHSIYSGISQRFRWSPEAPSSAATAHAIQNSTETYL